MSELSEIQQHDNIFMPNYSRIENEVIQLSHYIDFCDAQLDVYSIVILDLIIRCGAEIESLYKVLYRRDINSKLPSEIGEAIKSLNNRYSLDTKVLTLNGATFHFSNFNIMRPFNYKKNSDDDFYSVFCALKHDRLKSYHKSTLHILLLSLGALYILNQYYLDTQDLIENSFFGEILPTQVSRDTNIFSAFVFNLSQSTLEHRLDDLRLQSKITHEQLSIIKGRLMNKLNMTANHSRAESLYRIELTPEYEQLLTFGNTLPMDQNFTKAFTAFLLDDDRTMDELIDKIGISAFEPIASLYNATAQRHRFRMVINK